MGYRTNLGCFWLFLLILLIGGTPLLVGVMRLFLGFVVLALVGGALFTWWIRRNAVLSYTSGQSERHNRFVRLLVSILVRLAEIEGPLDKREVAVIRKFFQEQLGYRDERLLWVRDLIKESREHTQSVESICEEFRTSFGMQERFIVLQVLARVAEADGTVTPSEMAFIERVSHELGLDPFVGAFGTAAGGGAGYAPRPSRDSEIGEALSALGLPRGATADDAKRAWRQLSMENHPDRVAHLGDEFRQLAEERMRKINAAYETLKEAGLAN
jgi:DnaJ like chaperone protein